MMTVIYKQSRVKENGVYKTRYKNIQHFYHHMLLCKAYIVEDILYITSYSVFDADYSVLYIGVVLPKDINELEKFYAEEFKEFVLNEMLKHKRPDKKQTDKESDKV